MKKTLTLIIAFVMLATCFIGCASENANTETPAPTQEAMADVTAEPTQAPTIVPITLEPTAEPVVTTEPYGYPYKLDEYVYLELIPMNTKWIDDTAKLENQTIYFETSDEDVEFFELEDKFGFTATIALPEGAEIRDIYENGDFPYLLSEGDEMYGITKYIYWHDECVGAIAGCYFPYYSSGSSEPEMEKQQYFYWMNNWHRVAQFAWEASEGYEELEMTNDHHRVIGQVFYDGHFTGGSIFGDDSLYVDIYHPAILYSQRENLCYVIVDFKPGIDTEILREIAQSIEITAEGRPIWTNPEQ